VRDCECDAAGDAGCVAERVTGSNGRQSHPADFGVHGGLRPDGRLRLVQKVVVTAQFAKGSAVGQGLVEYALILMLVAIVVIDVLAPAGPALGEIFSNTVSNI